ncbi:excinuclease ABC subunit [Legionella busanensis]|uniref:UvrABC system protein C n=1 Tax=Legionella busanensis TaxID=190655 RepID=A0A378JKZ2_9GAMM|nr:excinuclease ABC subunit UvrC [Legionella busanensis]STX51996.1 excinuclease ABC subunit [Legionella busanensis]
MSKQILSNELSNFLANLTMEPGVYRMLDIKGDILYIGKAGNLKKRVSSYFSRQIVGAKTRSLVSQISSIEVTVTKTETEALLLESSLIKTFRPKYNVLMRDDKSYPYIHLTTEHTYPRLEMYRSKKKPQKGTYFGPYPSAGMVRDTLSTIQKVFKIRNCRDSYFNTRSRPCLQYQIKRCTAPCAGYISADDYQQSVNDAVKFLQGKCQDILKELELRMESAVQTLAYEQAAVLRDQIKSLRLVQEQQGVVQLRGDADVIAIEARLSFACVQCISIRDGHVIASQSFFPTVPDLTMQEDELRQQVLEAFISFYYVEVPERIPELLILDEAVPELGPLKDMLTKLRGKECRIQVNPRGIKARWLEFAKNNLRLAVGEHQASAATMARRYTALAILLELEKPIERMECFDISHTQGELTVASCVVFDAEGPRKSDYRRFNINGITPSDDYAAMQQVLSRRYKRLLQEQNLPDVLIIDGGKGQVSVAKRVLQELGIEGITLLGIAKGVDRKAGWERLILVAQEKEITLPSDSPALHLLQQIRDEAHRFAIMAHRKKRNTAGLESSLEMIEGVGPKRRHALLQRFGGLRELAKAPIEEIVKVAGINAELALRIYQHFHP